MFRLISPLLFKMTLSTCVCVCVCVCLLCWALIWSSDRFPVSLQPEQSMWLICQHTHPWMLRHVFCATWNTTRSNMGSMPALLSMFWFSVIQVGSLQSFSEGLTPMLSFLLAETAFLHEWAGGGGVWRFSWNVAGTVRDGGWGGCRERGDLKRVCEVHVICDVHSEAYKYFLLPVVGFQVFLCQQTAH